MTITYTTKADKSSGAKPGHFVRTTNKNWNDFRTLAKELDVDMNELVSISVQLLTEFTKNSTPTNNTEQPTQ